MIQYVNKLIESILFLSLEQADEILFELCAVHTDSFVSWLPLAHCRRISPLLGQSLSAAIVTVVRIEKSLLIMALLLPGLMDKHWV